MPTVRKTLLVTVATVCAFVGSTTPAQPHASTVGVTGFTSITLGGGFNAVSVSLLNKNAFVGAVLSPNGQAGNVLTLVGADLDFASLLTAGKSYYLEVRSPGVNAGARFEVDVAASRASANEKVTLLASSPTNTSTLIPNLSGCSVVIREHVTLSQVFGGLGNVLLQGGTASASADQVWFLNSATRAYKTYWLRVDDGGATVEWRSLTLADTTDYSSLPIRPGVGVFVFRQSTTPLTLRHMGMVRQTPFLWALPQGFSLVSLHAPVDGSFASMNLVKAGGWKGGGSAAAADQLQIWNGTLFQTYWFRANYAGTTQEWRALSPADTTNYLNAPALLHGDKAVIIHTQEVGAQRTALLFE